MLALRLSKASVLCVLCVLCVLHVLFIGALGFTPTRRNVMCSSARLLSCSSVRPQIATARAEGRRHLPLFSSTPEGAGEGDGEYLMYSPDGIVIRKTRSGVYKKKDSRDSLPFKIYISSDDLLGDKDKVIGNYRLDAQTSCGDILDLGEQGVFEVRKTIFLYRYNTMNQLHVIGKKLEVKPLSTKPMNFLQ